MERSAGVIMHIASLPGKFGIGTFGREAYEYVEFLFKTGLKYWQILPLRTNWIWGFTLSIIFSICWKPIFHRL